MLEESFLEASNEEDSEDTAVGRSYNLQWRIQVAIADLAGRKIP